MPEQADNLIFNTVAERLHSNRPVKAVGEIALTGAGFLYPPVKKLYRITRTLLADESTIPLQPSVEDTIGAVEEHIANSASIETDRLSTMQLTRFVNTLVQFSDRASAAEAMVTPNAQIEALHAAIIEKASTNGPLSYGDQLALALADTPHLPSALWNLLITSRQYARWRDTDIINGFPAFDTEEKIQRMIAWEQSVAAVKDRDQNGFQDTAGDGYYVWTHALAKVIYTALPETENWISTSYARAFKYGSYAMSASAALGKVSVFGTLSNHIPASRYGNAIGDVAARRTREINESSS